MMKISIQKIKTKLEILKNTLLVKCTPFILRIKYGDEQTAIWGLAAFTALFCLIVLLMPASGSSSGGHSHGHGHGHGGHEEHEGDEHHHEEENLVAIDDDALEANNMTIEEAQPQVLKPYIPVRGQIIANPNRDLNVRPRFSGIVKSVNKDFGDTVKKGDLLVVIESVSTRSTFSIRSAIDGIVADKNVVSGAFVPENESILRVVDLSSVWFQGKVPIADKKLLATGLSAEIKDRIFALNGTGTVAYLSPIADEDSQACDIRIEIENKDGEWKVGSFAEALVALKEFNSAISVKASALQKVNDETVVFIKSEEGLIAKPVKTGRMDNTWVEILSGIDLGDEYVSTNSFLAKAELLKSTAAHEH